MIDDPNLAGRALGDRGRLQTYQHGALVFRVPLETEKTSSLLSGVLSANNSLPSADSARVLIRIFVSLCSCRGSLWVDAEGVAR